MKGYINMKKRRSSSLFEFIILTLIVCAGVVIATTDLVGGEIKALLQQCFTHLTSSGEFFITLPRLIGAIFAFAACLWIACFISLILSALGKGSARLHTVSTLLGSLLKCIGFVLGIIWALSILGIDVTAAIAGVGIVALVLSFGAQSLVEDVVTGIFIMIEGRINVGDIVVIDDFRGVITSISARTTAIMDSGGNYKIVNNSDIRNIQNRSADNSLAVCDIGISYDTYIPDAEKVVEQTSDMLFEKYPDVFLKRPEYMGVQELGSSSVVLRITASINEENIFRAQRLMNREYKLAIDVAGIEIPFPQVVVHEPKAK